MQLSEIKVRYAGNPCAKCGRDMRVGWSAFFDASTKSLYCVPCGAVVKNHENAPPKESADELDSTINSLFEMIGCIDLKLSSIIEKLDKQVKAKAEVKPKAQ